MSSLLEHSFRILLTDIVRLLLWFVVLVVIFVPIERLFAVRPQAIFRKAILADCGYYFMNSLVPAILLSVPLGIAAWFVHGFVPDRVHIATAVLPLWARALMALVAGETGYYWAHRWSHEIPFLWRFHSVHHGAEKIDFLVNTRAHPFDMVFGRFCGLVPIYVLGLGGPLGTANSAFPILVGLIGSFWGFFIHANLKWRFGPLEWLISTPAFHHWHHTLTGPVNRNYASTFPWLDRLFGTYHLPRHAWPDAYGIAANIPQSVVGQHAHPPRRRKRGAPPVPGLS